MPVIKCASKGADNLHRSPAFLVHPKGLSGKTPKAAPIQFEDTALRLPPGSQGWPRQSCPLSTLASSTPTLSPVVGSRFCYSGEEGPFQELLGAQLQFPSGTF